MFLLFLDRDLLIGGYDLSINTGNVERTLDMAGMTARSTIRGKG
jgi:hypothetical protein